MLTIQKLILLLEPEKLQAFKGHLAGTGNALPLKLVQHIEDSGINQPETDALCELVYGDAEEKSKRKFFQLAHYTFRLTTFLARRYPFYLSHNIKHIEELLNKGEMNNSLQHAENTLDIAVKIEDFPTQIWVLKFLLNFSLIREKRKEAIRQQIILNNALKIENLTNEISLYIREHLNWKDKTTLTGNNDIDKHIAFFNQYCDHDSVQVKVLSNYGICYCLSFLDDKKFYTPEVREKLEFLADELDKNSYVIFAFSDDVLLNIDYLRLKHFMHEFNEDDILKEATKITKKWQELRFWQSHIDTAQIVSLSLQASYYVTRYCISYKTNYLDQIPAHVKENINETVLICERLIETLKEEPDAHVRFINLNNIYCTLLLLCGTEKIKRSTEILEGILINYQQIPFQKLYDAIFANLIIAYFSLENHQAVADCYRRYEKLTAKRVKIEENDLTIKSFYYVSQWKQSGREQYLEKIRMILQEIKEHPELESTKKLIEELLDYFKVPILS